MTTLINRPAATRAELLAIHKWLCGAARSTMVRKNNDYADADNPFGNLGLCEAMGVCPTDTGILIRLSDKLMRLAHYVRPGFEASVKDEGFLDTIEDAVNYLVLLAASRFAPTSDE